MILHEFNGKVDIPKLAVARRSISVLILTSNDLT